MQNKTICFYSLPLILTLDLALNAYVAFVEQDQILSCVCFFSGRSYYVIGKVKMSWQDARETCINIGGDLASCMYEISEVSLGHQCHV